MDKCLSPVFIIEVDRLMRKINVTVSLERVPGGLCMSLFLHKRPGFTDRQSLKSEWRGGELENVPNHRMLQNISTAMTEYVCSPKVTC